MNVQKIRDDFPILKNTGVIYFDNAAMTLKPKPVVAKTVEFYEHYCANVHRGAHRLSLKASEEYDRAHRIVADFIGAKQSEIAMAANTTHALNILALSLPWKKMKEKIATTNLEHHSNLLPWMVAAREHGKNLQIVKAKKDGSFDMDEWKSASKDAGIVSVTAASNVLGNKPPIGEIAKIAKDAGCLVCVDGAAAVGHMPFNVKKIGLDFCAFSSQKGLLGPTGAGVLYINEKRSDFLEPKFLGGGTIDSSTYADYKLARMPDRFEAGTPNIASVIGLGAGVKYVEGIGVQNIEKHLEKLVKQALEGMQGIKGIQIYGPTDAKSKVGIISFNVAGADPHEVALMLDESRKIATRSGHHCAYHLHRFLGVDGSVRASFSVYNTEEEVGVFLEELGKVAKMFGN